MRLAFCGYQTEHTVTITPALILRIQPSSCRHARRAPFFEARGDTWNGVAGRARVGARRAVARIGYRCIEEGADIARGATVTNEALTSTGHAQSTEVTARACGGKADIVGGTGVVCSERVWHGRCAIFACHTANTNKTELGHRRCDGGQRRHGDEAVHEPPHSPISWPARPSCIACICSGSHHCSDQLLSAPTTPLERQECAAEKETIR